LVRSQRLLNLRHPGYDRFIASFVTANPLHGLRRRLDEDRLAGLEANFVLLLTLALTGGVDRFVAERCRDLRARGLVPLILRPAQAGNTRRCELWTDALDAPNLTYEVPTELGVLTALLRRLQLAALEIQHFLHLDARLIEAVRFLGPPYDVFVHDYAWICPRVTLIDGSGRYCGEPDISLCNTCLRRNGSNLGERISVVALRKRSEKWLRQARRVIVPSADTAIRLQRYFPGLGIDVTSHQPTAVAAPRPQAVTASTVRVALIGAIGIHKGYEVLLACARDARRRTLPLEFIVIGYTERDPPLLKTGAVFIAGRYTESEVPHLLRREQPDIAFLPSVWPETWCYALDHALLAGLPVVAFDLGAIAERLRAVGSGVLLPLDMSAAQINDRLLELAARQRRSTDSRPLLGNLCFPAPAPTHSPATLSSPRGEGYKTMATNPEPGSTAAPDALSASVQVLPLPPGLYLFSVTNATATSQGRHGQLSLPAMHVGLGPGVRPEQVEFMAGPSTHGAWLFSPRDLLVTRVNSEGAILMVTSVRAPGGEVLTTKVERLDTRPATPPALTTSAAPTKLSAVAPAPTDSTRPSRARVIPAHQSETQPLAAATAEVAKSLPLQIAAHIRSRGDMSFAEVDWAGRMGQGLWIESFSVRPLEHFTAQDIEYKALTGSGFETSWISEDHMCGTKGMSVPLVGFAVRLKPTLEAAAYDCEYSGYFQSGAIVGPLRNGAPCRSMVANDPLEGVRIRIVKRTAVTVPAAAPRLTAAPDLPSTPARGPSLGRNRDGHSPARGSEQATADPTRIVASPAAHSAARATAVKAARTVLTSNGSAKPVRVTRRKPNRNTPPSSRSSTRRQ
jgi:glycosyltransferase involved in cell wall biosynthesis